MPLLWKVETWSHSLGRCPRGQVLQSHVNFNLIVTSAEKTFPCQLWKHEAAVCCLCVEALIKKDQSLSVCVYVLHCSRKGCIMELSDFHPRDEQILLTWLGSGRAGWCYTNKPAKWIESMPKDNSCFMPLSLLTNPALQFSSSGSHGTVRHGVWWWCKRGPVCSYMSVCVGSMKSQHIGSNTGMLT